MSTHAHTPQASVIHDGQRRGVKTQEVGPSRFVSEPAALGLAAFALTTMALSVINAGILPATRTARRRPIRSPP